MSEAIIAALIAAIATLLGNIISNSHNSNKLQQQMRVNQAVTDTKIEELTREVREHNNFARRMPVVEDQVETIKKTMERLEGYHRE